ncbi:MAG TPA: M61 family peptidase [Candidatus Eisenbacteria bacterium]
MPVLVFTLAASAALALAAPRARAEFGGGTIALAVDASEAPRKILHARMTVPVKPGPLALCYPKWIPGEHGPTGPLTDVAGLHLTAGGKPLRWERDLVDMHTVRCEVPAGVATLDVAFDFISPSNPEGYSSAASCTEKLMVLSWNQVLLYPAGLRTDDLTFAASVKLPAGWQYGTALPVRREGAGQIQFAPASLTTLVDSPVLAGLYFRRVDLAPGATPHQYLDMAADSREALAMSDDQVAKHRRLVNEAYALFGARHFREYHFLLTLSDHVAHFGLEHHESSDDRVDERMWLDDDLRAAASGLMSHELVHSWNGKYRRPADLATPDYQQPMKDDLLWVYEGLTQYLGYVLAGRSGLRSPQQDSDNLALVAASLDNRPGRTWRPLIDTAVEAQLLYEASRMWESWRRGTDFYNEGLLIWLEADVLIRQQTRGAKSLDDFCRRFHGGASGAPKVVPYTFDDVVSTMNLIAPYDWRTFFTTRLESLSPHAPTGGITEGGWRMAWGDSVPGLLRSMESARKYVDLTYSIGMRVRKEDGVIEDVIPGSPCAAAGVAPGMKLVAANGRKWSKDVLRAAVRATKGSREPLELLTDNGEFFRTFRVDYHGGERYPRLERAPGKPDLVTAILKPLTSPDAPMTQKN